MESTKRCGRCRGLFPAASFTYTRYSKDNLVTNCKPCNAQYKMGSRVPKETPQTRSVTHQNTSVLTLALSTNELTSYFGLNYVDGSEHMVYFGPNAANGLPSMCVLNRSDNKVVQEICFTKKDIPELIRYLLNILKMLNIRLEFTEYELLKSKTEIYYMIVKP